MYQNVARSTHIFLSHQPYFNVEESLDDSPPMAPAALLALPVHRIAPRTFKRVELAKLSHELRTPLNSIIGFASLLSESIPEEFKNFADIIGQRGHDLSALITRFLDYIYITNGYFVPESEETDMLENLSELMDPYRRFALENGVSFHFKHPRLPFNVRVDQNALAMIVSNVLENAVTYTLSGSISLAVWVYNNVLCIRVSDTGIGMNPAFLTRLFNPFTQENRNQGPTRGGLGLGMAIAKALIDELRGTIQVSSRENNGTTIALSIPLPGENETKLI